MMKAASNSVGCWKITSIISLFSYFSLSRFCDLYNWITHWSLIWGCFSFQKKVNERENDSMADSFRKLEVFIINNVWACTSQFKSFTCIMLNTYTFESLCNIHTNFSCEITTLICITDLNWKLFNMLFFYNFLQNVNKIKWNATLDAWVTI